MSLVTERFLKKGNNTHDKLHKLIGKAMTPKKNYEEAAKAYAVSHTSLHSSPTVWVEEGFLAGCT